MSSTNNNYNDIIINNDEEDDDSGMDICELDSPRSSDEEPTEEDLQFIAAEGEVEYEDDIAGDDTPDALLGSMDPLTRQVFERTTQYNGSNDGVRRSLRLMSRSFSIVNHVDNEMDDDDEDDEYIPSEEDEEDCSEDEDDEEDCSEDEDDCTDEGDVNQC